MVPVRRLSHPRTEVDGIAAEAGTVVEGTIDAARGNCCADGAVALLVPAAAAPANDGWAAPVSRPHLGHDMALVATGEPHVWQRRSALDDDGEAGFDRDINCPQREQDSAFSGNAVLQVWHII